MVGLFNEDITVLMQERRGESTRERERAPTRQASSQTGLLVSVCVCFVFGSHLVFPNCLPDSQTGLIVPKTVLFSLVVA